MLRVVAFTVGTYVYVILPIKKVGPFLAHEFLCTKV